MRARAAAPVDEMGCHVIPEYNRQNNSVASQNLQVLISLLLSSQTKDQHTFAAVQNIRHHFHPLEITPQRILSLDDALLDNLIHGVGFHAKKTVYMKKIAAQLAPGGPLDEKIPTTLEELVKTFAGIGPKMGILYLQNAQPYADAGNSGASSELSEQGTADIATSDEYGLAVDTHVLRLSQQFRLVFPIPRKPTITPEIARMQLEQIVPKEQWKETNPMLVGFGQTICGSRSKKCDECLLSGTGLCAADKRKGNRLKRPAKELDDEELDSHTLVKSEVKLDEELGSQIQVKTEGKSFSQPRIKLKRDSISSSLAQEPNLAVDIEDLAIARRRRLRPRQQTNTSK
ncbi:uncharacterized protein V1518DRAFT_370197 [Limtongia smithiae]|uniref:uncharacterized protein n=1 Tax=Limtongia smithiae TaxID=1125753 RepID=UPI0034CF942C